MSEFQRLSRSIFNLISFRSQPEDTQIMNILRQRTTDIEVKKYCVSLLEKYGSFKYTLQVLEDLDQKVRQEVDKLGGNVHLIALMDELKNWADNKPKN
jgi:geranylgeranyl diphosphate synthase type 3